MKIVVESKKLDRSLEVDPESLITFQEGIPGFPSLKKYLLTEYEKGHLFLWLQSIEDPDLGFVVIDPLVIHPEYAPPFPKSELEILKIEDKSAMAMLSIVTLPQDNPMKLTVNLMAPLLINHQLRIGKQVVLHDSGYKVREPILKFPEKNRKLVSNR